MGYKGRFEGLYDPATGIEYGCKKLSQCVKRYPGNLDSAIASYNAGSARMIKGAFVNQGYVDSVKKYMEKFREI
jgi:soluble lytic murein transglycosylase-like protein